MSQPWSVASDVNWRINAAGYVEGTFQRKTILQHRFIVDHLVGIPHDTLHVHHINGYTTDNRPGNLMLVAPGPHAWEVWLRSTSTQRDARDRIADERAASGGILSSYWQQVETILDTPLLEPDDTAWQRIGEAGFWSEGDVTVAATGPVERFNLRHLPPFLEVLKRPDDDPDKAFLKAVHTQREKARAGRDPAVLRRGGLF